MRVFPVLVSVLLLASCATTRDVAPDVPEVVRANAVLRLTRAEIDTILGSKAKTLATASGKTVAREGARYRLKWTEYAVPVVSGRERVGQIERYDGTTELEKSDFEGLRKLMEEARVRAKGVRVPADLASPTLVRCDARQCAIDLPIEATKTATPPVAALLRKALAAQPVEAATSGGR